MEKDTDTFEDTAAATTAGVSNISSSVEDKAVVDPWAVDEPTDAEPTTATESENAQGKDTDQEGEAEHASKQSLGERWGTFQARLQSRWNAHTSQMNQEVAGDPGASTSVKLRPPPADSVTSNGDKAAKEPFWKRLRNPSSTTAPPSLDKAPSMRAGVMSITLQKPAVDSKWGVGMEAAPEGSPHAVHIAVLAGMGLLEKAPLVPGDFLTHLNQQACTSSDDTIQQLLEYPANTNITLQVQAKVEGSHPNLVQAVVLPPPSATEPLIPGMTLTLKTMEVPPSESTENVEADGNADAETKAPHEESTAAESATDESTQTTEEATAEATPVDQTDLPSFLQIESLDPDGWLAQSALQVGDYVIAINGKPCTMGVSLEQANEWMTQLESNIEMVTILVLRGVDPFESYRKNAANQGGIGWLRQAKRAGIALGGGAMVGVGLIFIPTLPPPFGEVLIIGGVSVLGTEFEAPKRVMRNARDSLERVVGRDNHETTDANADGTATAAEDDTETTNSDNQEVPTDDKTAPPVEGEAETGEDAAASTDPDATTATTKPTMKDRFHRFGRNVVLPFLDQVVGDKSQEMKETTATTTTTTTATASEEEEMADAEVPTSASQDMEGTTPEPVTAVA